jgi:putative peptidoglycan lipid II flippase
VFFAHGDVVAAALLQTGRFGPEDARFVWAVLAGSSVGLLAATLGRLYASTYYALGDTRTPLRYALVHVVTATVGGYVLAVRLPGWLNVPGLWGAAGLTVAASGGAWVETLLLRRTLNQRIGVTGLPVGFSLKLWAGALAAAAVAWAVRVLIPPMHPIVLAVVVLAPFSTIFLGLALFWRLPEASVLLTRLRLR